MAMQKQFLVLIFFFALNLANGDIIAQVKFFSAGQFNFENEKQTASNAIFLKQPSKNEFTKSALPLSAFVSKFYFKAWGGYGFLSPGSYRVQSSNAYVIIDQNNVPHDTTIQTESNKGIGIGFRAGGGIGYVVNDFLNIGIDFEFQRGKKLSNSFNHYTNDYNFDSTYDDMFYKALTLSPHVIFKALSRPGYFIYNKLGILLTLPYTLYTSGNSAYPNSQNWPPVTMMDTLNSYLFVYDNSYTGKYKISFGVGFNAALGVNARLTDNLRLFAEIFGNFSALSPSSSQLINLQRTVEYGFRPDYNTNPVTYDSYTFPSALKKIVNTSYIKNGATGSVDVNDNSDPNDPNILVSTYKAIDKKFTVNMNSMGISFGIYYRF
jgi:hypothetical protein